jgi:hypothetical protein
MILSDLIVYLLTRKRKPKVLSPNIKESFRNAPLNKKIGYLVILLIYLVLPFPFLLIFGIALFFVIIFYVGGFLNKLKGVLLSLLILLVGVGVFFTFYLVFVPEALRDYEYEVPEMSLSDAGTKAYHKLIDDSEFYHKEPVAYYENNDFGFVALRTYIEWDYSSGDPISVCFKFRFYKIGNFREKDYYVVLRKDELIIAEVYYDGQNEIIIESLEESMLYFEVRKSQNNDLVYTSDEFPMKKDFYNQDEEIYYGGQYMENSKKVTILFFVFTHLSAIVTGLLLYIFRNFIFVNMKVNRKQLFFGKLFKGEA